MTVRTDCAIPLPPSAYTTLKLPFESPCPWTAIGSWFSDRSPPSPPVAGLRNKATFPFLPTLVSWELAFERRAARPGFANNIVLGIQEKWDPRWDSTSQSLWCYKQNTDSKRHQGRGRTETLTHDWWELKQSSSCGEESISNYSLTTQ